jgi:hypothetical protein
VHRLQPRPGILGLERCVAQRTAHRTGMTSAARTPACPLSGPPAIRRAGIRRHIDPRL